jgi:hypothetical protein
MAIEIVSGTRLHSMLMALWLHSSYQEPVDVIVLVASLG